MNTKERAFRAEGRAKQRPQAGSVWPFRGGAKTTGGSNTAGRRREGREVVAEEWGGETLQAVLTYMWDILHVTGGRVVGFTNS